MIKRYSDFINEGLAVGTLPSTDWLNILCEDLDDDLNVVILTDRLCDNVGRLVSAKDGRYITNNEVFSCTEILFLNNNNIFRIGLNKPQQLEELRSKKILINKIVKKIESESYKVVMEDQFFKNGGGYMRLVIYPINIIK